VRNIVGYTVCLKHCRHASRGGYIGQRGHCLTRFSHSLALGRWNCGSLCKGRHCQSTQTVWNLIQTGTLRHIYCGPAILTPISSVQHDQRLGFQLLLFLRGLHVGGYFSRALSRVVRRLGILDVWTNTVSPLQQVLQLIIAVTWFIFRRRYKGTNYDP